MKKILTFLMVLVALSASAQTVVELGEGHTLTIPEGMSQMESTGLLYVGQDSISIVAISKLSKQDYDKDKVKDKLDLILFKLKDFHEVDSKSDGLFERGKDYKLKFYQSNRGGLKAVTYTSYVYEYPFCIMMQYTDDAALSTLTAITDSEHYESSWWHTIWMFFSCNAGLLTIVLFLMVIVCIPIHNEWFGILFGLSVSIWLCSPLWGIWSVWLPLVALGSFMGLAASWMSFEEAVKSAIDGM